MVPFWVPCFFPLNPLRFSFSRAAGLGSPYLFLDPTILLFQLFATKRTELASVLRQAHSATICGTPCQDDCHIVRKQLHQWQAACHPVRPAAMPPRPAASVVDQSGCLLGRVWSVLKGSTFCCPKCVMAEVLAWGVLDKHVSMFSPFSHRGPTAQICSGLYGKPTLERTDNFALYRALQSLERFLGRVRWSLEEPNFKKIYRKRQRSFPKAM